MPRGKQSRLLFDEHAGIGLLEVLAGGQGIVADKVIACLARADRQSLGLACKALQDEVAARWRCLKLQPGMAAGLLPKLRGVEEVGVFCVPDENGLNDFYRLLLELKRIGARIKAIDTYGRCLPPERAPQPSAQLAVERPQQLHNWVLTANSLLQLQPAPYLESVTLCPGGFEAALLQPLLRAPALTAAGLCIMHWVADISLDLSACTQLQSLRLAGDFEAVDLAMCLEGLQLAPGLKKLHICDVVAHSQLLELISSSLPELDTLSLVRCYLPEPGPSAHHPPQQLSFPGLKELELQLKVDPCITTLQQLLSATTGLQQLILITDGPIPPLPLDSPGLAQLEELTLHEILDEDQLTLPAA